MSAVTAEVSAVTDDADVDVVATDDATHSSSSAAVAVDTKEANEAACTLSVLEAADVDTDTVETDAADVDADGSAVTSADVERVCLLHQLSQHGTSPASSKSGAVFWKSSWRQHLCSCPSCMVSVVVGHAVCNASVTVSMKRCFRFIVFCAASFHC